MNTSNKLKLTLLNRDTFRESVFTRDNHTCVNCGITGVPMDAHHIIERRLFTAEDEHGGYFIENGLTLCDDHDGIFGCHRLAEQTLLSPEVLREKAGITRIILPDGTYDGIYSKWLDPVMPDGRRGRGPLFFDESIQKILREGNVLNLYTNYVKYPRTYHAPTSPGRTKDDRAHRVMPFSGKDIIVTLKMDGENTTINSDGYVHARSLEGEAHPSQTWVRNIAAKIAYEIDPGYRICGENLYASHTLKYENLSSYFMLFSVWDDKNISQSWEDVNLWANILNIPTVPILYRGKWDEKEVVKAFEAYQEENGEQEGWVARSTDAFPYAAFRENVAKWVRPGHVQKTVHNWRNNWYANENNVNKLQERKRERFQ